MAQNVESKEAANFGDIEKAGKYLSSTICGDKVYEQVRFKDKLKQLLNEVDDIWNQKE